MSTATIERNLTQDRAGSDRDRLARLMGTEIEYVGEPTEEDLNLAYGLDFEPEYGDVPLLGREREAVLFRLMNALKWRAEEVRRGIDPESPCPVALDELECRLARANEIRSWLTRANRRLVVSIARKFVNPAHDHQELVAEGHLPLLRAVELFDVSRGFRFSTYATWAVTKHLTRHVQRERTRSDRFQTGRDEAVEVVPDHRGGESDEGLLLRAGAVLRGLITRLDEREQRILAARFGLGGATEQTLSQLGEQFGITKERVRQIELAARAKLRKFAVAERLDQLAS